MAALGPMLYNRVIASLLLQDGRLVKGVQFNDHRDAGNPVSTVRAYNAQKIDEIILLDIKATLEKRSPHLSIIEKVAFEAEVPLTVGGGINSLDVASDCFSVGADKVSINAASYSSLDFLSKIANRFGRQAVVANLDIIEQTPDELHQDKTNEHHNYALYRYWDDMADVSINWIHWAQKLVAAGAGEIRLLVVNREGSRKGYDLNAWRLLREAVNVPIILEGGAGNLQDLEDAMSHNVSSLAMGTMLVFSDNNIFQVKRHLKNAGFQVRM